MRLKCPLTPASIAVTQCSTGEKKWLIIQVLWILSRSLILLSILIKVCARTYLVSFWCFYFFYFLNVKSCLRHVSKHLFFLWKDAKKSLKSAPKSPCSVPLLVYTAACVYKVQDHTIYGVTTVFFFTLSWSWGVFLFFFLFSPEEDFVAFLLGEEHMLVQRIKQAVRWADCRKVE